MQVHHLKKGSKLAFLNVSDIPAKISPERLQTGKEVLEGMGFEIFIPKKALDENINPKAQAAFLHDAFEDDSIDGIICTSGGTKCLSLLPHIDFKRINAHPKLLMGTSDCSHLLHAVYNHCGFITVDGPVVNRLEEWSETGKKAFLDYFVEKKPIKYLADDSWHILSGGKTSGKALVGNDIVTLTTLSLLKDINLNQHVLFLENHSDETGTFVDYWFSVYEARGIFDKIKALILGTFITKNPLETVQSLYSNYLADKNIPVIHVDFFGEKEYHPLPIGAMCTVDANSGSIEFER